MRSNAANLGFVFLEQLGCLGVFIQAAGFILLNPHADQLSRNVVPLGERVSRLPGNKLLCDLPLELNAVGTLYGDGFHPSKAQLIVSIHKPQPSGPRGALQDGVIGRRLVDS